jgi:hypothetical protein
MALPITLGLCVLCVVGVLTCLMPLNHADRVLISGLPLVVLVPVGVTRSRRGAFFAGLAWLVIAWGAATAAWWFVPTFRGLSLWEARAEAERQIEALRALAPGDVEGFKQDQARRDEVGDEFRQFRPLLEAAVRAWAERTVEAAVTGANSVLERQPMEAARQLRQAAQDLGAAGSFPEAQDQLRAARKGATLACLKEARQKTRTLVAVDRFAAAADVADHLATDLAADASEVGIAAELEQFRNGFAFLRQLARQAKRPDPK